MSSTLTTPTATGTPGGAGAPNGPQDIGAADGLRIVGRSRRTSWVIVACAGLVVAGTAAAVTHLVGPSSAPGAAPVPAVGAVDPSAAVDGREWEQRSLSPAQAPSRGRVAEPGSALAGPGARFGRDGALTALAAADRAEARLAPRQPTVAGSIASPARTEIDGRGTGHGRVLVVS
jgi:hypothetical protein